MTSKIQNFKIRKKWGVNETPCGDLLNTLNVKRKNPSPSASSQDLSNDPKKKKKKWNFRKLHFDSETHTLSEEKMRRGVRNRDYR